MAGAESSYVALLGEESEDDLKALALQQITTRLEWDEYGGIVGEGGYDTEEDEA